MSVLATSPKPLQVFCAIDHDHRDVRIAEAILVGRITVAGRTIDVGVAPDWTSDPYPADREWRVDWVKFYYGLDLAHAWRTTGDNRYLRCWERLVTSYMEQCPPGADATEVVARRIQNWIYAWNRFEDGGAEVSSDVARTVVDYVWQEALFVRDHLSAERNHRTLELYALLVAAVAFPDRDDHAGLRALAMEGLCANLLDDVRPDGVHREASPHYHCIALRSWLGAEALARQCGLSLGSAFRDRLQAACEFAVQVHRPDGRIPACSDADCESYLDVVLHAAELFDREDWVWVATGGRGGRPPVACHSSFTDGGYFLQRSGWASQDAPRYLLFDCGPLGDGGHGHYDLLNVEIYGSGRPLIVDPGRYTYSEAGECNWRRWFKGTAAHNTVTVDGLDQTPYARRKPRGPIASGRLLRRTTAPDLDVLVGEARSARYDAVHTRTVIFVAREYWVILDHLAAPSPHDYQLRWHLSPEASTSVEVDATLSRVRAAGVTLSMARGRRARLEEGWYAPRYGVKQPATVVVAETRAYSTIFVTVVHPHTGGVATGDGRDVSLGFVSSGDQPTDRTVIEVNGVGHDGACTDFVTWSLRQDVLELPGFRGIARGAWVRRDAGQQHVGFAAVDVLEEGLL